MPSIRKYFFHHIMMDFVNKLELSDQKYQTNKNVRDEHYKGRVFISYEEPCVIRYISQVNVFYVYHIIKRKY